MSNLVDQYQRESVKLYLLRQEYQRQLMKLQQDIQICELEMVKLDGKIELLHALASPASPNLVKSDFHERQLKEDNG